MSDQNRDLLDELLAQEERLVFERFDNDMAIAIGMMLIETARSRGLAITVDVTRHGHQLFHASLPGTTPDNDQWVLRKNAVVNRFGHSSFYVGRLSVGVADFAGKYYLDPLGFSPHGGAFPILLRGTGPIGTITVSGLPQADDHALVVEILTRFLAGETG